MMKVKLQRGQKLCPNCNSINAARQRVCKYCSFEFMSKNTPIKNEIKNWKELPKGSYIKVIQGTGPYYLCNKQSEEHNVGDRICLGNIGVYKVISIDSTGLRVYGASPKNAGFTYLYMGEPYQSEITGTFFEPYRIKKVKKREK